MKILTIFAIGTPVATVAFAPVGRFRFSVNDEAFSTVRIVAKIG